MTTARTTSPTHRTRLVTTIAAVATALALAPALALAQGRGEAQPGAAKLDLFLDSLELRELGPAVMGGRVSDLAAHSNNPATFYVGFATGGLWKTENQGMSWAPLFDDQSTSSIGAVALAPSNPNVIWVGTGEPQNRQSSPWGDGVYRSMDGGRTWQHLGLTETRHIARIVVHPRDPDVAWVAAPGHLWGPNEERGVFKTTDGGETWAKVLYVDENTGAIDLVMDPGDPNTLFAALYQRRRTVWGFSASGEGSGLYRTLDGGATWQRLEEGLPEGDMGRIGLDVYRRDGNLVYAIIESSDDGRGLYRSRDRGETWEKVSDRNPRPMYFSLVRIDPTDPERIYLGGVRLSISDDGGKTWREGDQAEGIHVDHHALWIDPDNSDHVILGNDGGVASSWDRGVTWRHHNNIAVGQFYEVGADMRDPYYVCGGLQDNSSWCGPSQTLTEYGIRNSDWYDVSGGDGFYNEIDPSNPMIMYTESQGGNLRRYHVDTGETQRIRPVRRTTETDTLEYDYNWNTPIVISQHDPATIYVGANHVLRSRDRGVTWEEASPDLTRQIDRDTLLIMGMKVDSLTLSGNDGVSRYGTLTALAESPLDARVLYAGTDDGMLHVTRDGGATWTDIGRGLDELRHGVIVSRIEPSHHVAGRVYVALDGHYSDDYSAYVYVSEDFGRSWRRITSGLPAWSVNVVREHPRTASLLFVGNEVGAYVSFDRGASWNRLTGNMPTVPVDDIMIHPRENDLILGTHGRSIWVLDDVSVLEGLAAERSLLASAAHVFPVRRATLWSRAGGWPFWGDIFEAANPPDGAVIRYWLGSDVVTAGPARVATAAAASASANGSDSDSGSGSDSGTAAAASGSWLERRASAPRDSAVVEIEILDAAGDVVRTLEAPAKAGLHQVVWDLRIDAPYEPEDDDEGEDRGRFSRAPRGPRVLPGTYTARVIAGTATPTTPVEVRYDPRIQVSIAVLEARQESLLELYRLAKPLYEAGQALREVEERVAAVREVLGAGEGEGEGERSGEAEREGAGERSGDAPDAGSPQPDAKKAILAEADSLAAAADSARETLEDAQRSARVGFVLEGVSARPTADQLWQIQEAWRVGREAVAAVNAIVGERLPALEAKVYTEAARPAAVGRVEVGGGA